jgi:hypothetical protein
MNEFWEIITIFLLIALTGIFLITRWIYFDAKSRRINPLPWILITIFISPNFIGLILYILFRPKLDKLCSKCQNYITKDMNYCGNCGAKIDDDIYLPVHKISNKSLIWGIILLLVFSISSLVGIVIYSVSDFNNTTNSSISGNFESGYARSMSNINFNNKWKCSFHSLKGSKNGHFKAKSENPALIYSSEITKGNITFNVYDDNNTILETIPANISGEITNLVQGKKYKVIATTEGITSGKYSFEMK